jgi:beta-lactamase superfamily II metal-dependent hydrolase
MHDMNSDGLEIDFLPVGDGEKSGDAIVVRYGNLHGSRDEQTIVVIDGGFSDDGEAIVELVNSRFLTNSVDIVISTHPDQDHVNGLKVVLENMEVAQLAMHLPWNRSQAVAESKRLAFASPRVDDKLERNFAAAAELEDIAAARGVPVIEPFAGMQTSDGKLTVLSPSEEFYDQLMSQVADSERSLLSQLIHKAASQIGEAAQRLVPESLHIETLTDWGETSPQNNSSVITLFRVGDKAALLTGDAGMPALEQAAESLEALGLAPGGLTFVQVPHHGSRRNVGPTVLNRILGPIGQAEKKGTAFVSAAKASTKHPAKKVTNAFKRRGYPVHGTDGQSKWHYFNAPDRDDYTTSEPYPLHTHVEADEG